MRKGYVIEDIAIEKGASGEHMSAYPVRNGSVLLLFDPMLSVSALCNLLW